MKMTWKTLLAAGCALSMLFTMPGSAVLAEELQEDAVIVSEAAQIDSEEADLDTDISADIDENAPDSGTYDAIELPADAVEEVPEMNEPFPSAETDEAVTYEDEIAVDEIAIEENASLESEEIVGAGDDYPANLKNAAIDAIVDPWNFYNRECTSFAAWCLNSRNGVKFTNQYLGASRWGNANTWGTINFQDTFYYAGKGLMVQMSGENGYQRLEYHAPTRGLLGSRGILSSKSS